jgi:hypothetical protein
VAIREAKPYDRASTSIQRAATFMHAVGAASAASHRLVFHRAVALSVAAIDSAT